MSAVTPLGVTTPTSGTSSASNTNAYNLKSEDFIKMMVTQLQNQDPMDPAKNQDLLAQMSQIGQLQSSTQLQTTLKSMMLQTQLSGASSLIGKSITAMDTNGNPYSGTVTSVSVAGGNVSLNLDTGQTALLTQVTSVNNGASMTAPVPVAAGG